MQQNKLKLKLLFFFLNKTNEKIKIKKHENIYGK